MPTWTWNDSSTFALIYPWALFYPLHNRNNIPQKLWEKIAAYVNYILGETGPNLTANQCKNRMRYLETTYRSEKQKVISSNGSYTSSWPFFLILDNYLGAKFVSDSPVHSSVLKISESMNIRHPTFADTLMHTSNMTIPEIPMPNQFRGDLTAFPPVAEDSRVSRSELSDDDGGKKKKKKKRKFDESNERSMADLKKMRKECIKELECLREKLFGKMKVQSVGETSEE